MAVLLQYWQDHTIHHLYGGRFHQTSDLATTLIQDINPWLPHKSRFGWGYVATHATLWLDLRDQFVEEHVEEWAAQKCWTGALNKLERDTEVIYQTHIIKRQEDKMITDSKEAAAKELLPEQQVAHAERQAGATPMKADATSTSTGAALYPDWIMRSKTKPIGCDVARPYQTPREDTGRDLMLDVELDAASVFDPLQLASQSSQPDPQDCSMSDTTLGAEGPRTRCTTARCQPAFRPSTWLRWAYYPRCRP